jgi:hypothetical protein
MNKNRQDYIYNPREFRRPRGERKPTKPAAEKNSRLTFAQGLILGLLAGYYIAKHM